MSQPFPLHCSGTNLDMVAGQMRDFFTWLSISRPVLSESEKDLLYWGVSIIPAFCLLHFPKYFHHEWEMQGHLCLCSSLALPLRSGRTLYSPLFLPICRNSPYAISCMFSTRWLLVKFYFQSSMVFTSYAKISFSI